MNTFGLGRQNSAFGLGQIYPQGIGVAYSGRRYQKRIWEINGTIYGEIPGLFGKVTGTVDPYSEEELALLMMEDLM